MANFFFFVFFFICRVYFTAITSHFNIKQSKKKNWRISFSNEVFPETQFMSKWPSGAAPTLPVNPQPLFKQVILF